MAQDEASSARLSFAIVAATVILAIGLPLIGVRTFLGSDVLLRFHPWSERSDVDATITAAPIGDTIDAAYPARTQFFDRLDEGDFAEWNPYPSGGSPLGVVPNSGGLDPLNLPYLFLPDRLAVGWVKALEIAVAVAGMAAFLRNFGVRLPAGTVAGLAYAFNGFQVVWTNWPQPHVAAWIPALFWAAERLIRGPTAPRLATLAGVVAAMLFGGFPAVVGYAFVVLGPYLIVRALMLARQQPALRRVPVIGRQAAVVAAAIALGLGLAALQLGPFSEQLAQQDIVDRQQTSDSHLASKLLVTAAVPNAFGSPQQGFSYLPGNYMESQAYIGSAALVLAALALLRCRAGGRPGLTAFFAVAAAATTVMIFFGGPLLGAAQDATSLFGSSFVGRLRSVWAFLLAVLVGFGADTIGRSMTAPSWRRRFAQGIGLAAAVVALGAAVRVIRTGDAEGHGGAIASSVGIAVVAALVTVALVMGAQRWRWSDAAVLGVTAVVAIEALFFVGPFWPRISNDRFYPVTPTHEFLADNVGEERVALSGLTLYPGTTGHYDLRTLTGHSFHWPTWRELLEAVDPGAMSASTTFSFTSFREVARMQSPILDRLAVRYVVVPVAAPQVGAFDDQPPPTGAIQLAAGERIEFEVPARPLRAVIVDLVTPGIVDGASPQLVVEVTGPDGVTVRGARAFRRGLTAGGHQVPIAGEHLPIAGPMTVAISLEAAGGAISLATTDAGQPSLDFIVPRDDGLRLAFADGAAAYENLDALPRIRFVGNAEVIADPAARVAALSDGVDSDVVILSEEPARTTSEGQGQIRDIRDEIDTIEIDLDVDAAGYLVIADAMQHGWNASIDGRQLEVLDADHAVVAVAVPEGRHTVRFSFDPETARSSLLLSAVSLVTLALLAMGPYIRRRRARRALVPATSADGTNGETASPIREE